MSWVYRRPHDYRPSQRLGHAFRVLAVAAGAMSANESLSFTRSGTITGTGTLQGAKSLTITETGTLFDAGTVQTGGSAQPRFTTTGTLTGSGALAATRTVQFTNTATPFGTNAYQQSMRPARRRPPPVPWDFHAWDARRWTIFPYTVNTATAGFKSIAISANGTLTATGRLIGADQGRFTEGGTLRGTGALIGSKSLVFSRNATLGGTASGAITAIRAWGFSTTGALTGTGNMTGLASPDFSAQATTSVVVPPSANEALRFSSRGTLRNASAGAGVVTDISFSTVDGLEIFFNV